MNTHTPTPIIVFILAIAASAASLAQTGCGSDDSSTDAATETEESSASDAQVRSSIREGAELTQPIPWKATVDGVGPGEVLEVRFLIDGKLAHVERETPYEFAGAGNVLLPGTLGPGSHTFAVNAELLDGPRLTTASTATVSNQAEGVPAEVLGSWTRTVTPAEVKRTQDFRVAASGDALPTGTWKLKIGDDGVARYTDPFRRSDSLTVGQVRFEHDGGLVVGNEVPNFPGASEGGFCPDTVGTGEYRWSVEGDALVVQVVDDRECADRNSFWSGTFTPR